MSFMFTSLVSPVSLSNSFPWIKKASAFSDYSEEDEGFQILRVTTSLADSIAVSLSVTSSSSSGLFCIPATSRLNMCPDNGGLPVPTTSCDIFIWTACRGWIFFLPVPSHRPGTLWKAFWKKSLSCSLHLTYETVCLHYNPLFSKVKRGIWKKVVLFPIHTFR